MTKEILTDAKEGRKIVKTILIATTVIVFLLIMAILAITGDLFPKTEPIVSINDKSCQFVVMGDTSRAICSDGSQYKVELLVNPLP
jgi:hypothetical protein